MDGNPVTGEPSPFAEINREGEHISYTEMFLKIFPEYLAMGMSYAEFWRYDPWLVVAYRKAHDRKQKYDEWARWRQGAYFYDALLRVAPVMRAAFGKGKVEAGKYPDKPWPLTEAEARKREEEERIGNMKRMFEQLTKESEDNEKKEAGDNGGD